MKLLLTSSGFTNPTIVKALKELAGSSLKNKNLAFIPTAANLNTGDKKWLINDLDNCRKQGFKEIDIVDISAVKKEIWLPKLENADILMFGGGNTYHLVYWMKKSGLSKILPELLKTRVYVGISAGSMAVTGNLALSNRKKKDIAIDYGENPGEKGLSYVDFLVRPHLNSRYFPSITKDNVRKFVEDLKETVYVIDDDTAIKVDGNVAEVVSEGDWKKFN